MKIILAIVIFALSLPPLIAAHNITDSVWISFFTGLSSSLVMLGVGVIAVNFYLESAARQGAVKALFMLSQRAIRDFHNDWIAACWAKFGREEYGRIGQELINAKLDVTAIKKETRIAIYQLYADSPSLRNRVIELESMLSELTRMVGWSLDAKLLTACLLARSTIAELKAVPLDKSDESIDLVVEHIFHLDGTTQSARSTLMKLAGIKEKD
jgi:hypothetical protein